MTPEKMQATVEANVSAIAALSNALDVLVSQFLRPTSQQALANYERLERIEAVVEANVSAIANLSDVTAANQQQLAANTEAITALVDSLRAFDIRLEETRSLVAENGSQIAQLSVKIEANATMIAGIGVKTDANAIAIADSRQETEALKEITRTQLAAIIASGRRIDRLEQQAS